MVANVSQSASDSDIDSNMSPLDRVFQLYLVAGYIVCCAYSYKVDYAMAELSSIEPVVIFSYGSFFFKNIINF